MSNRREIIGIGNQFDWERADALLPIAQVGAWISEQLNRQNSSRVGKAILASRQFRANLEQQKKEEAEKQEAESAGENKTKKKKKDRTFL